MQSRDRPLPLVRFPHYGGGASRADGLSLPLCSVFCVLREGVGLFFKKKKKRFLLHFPTTPRCPFKTAPVFVGRAMADRGVDLSALPKEVRDQLAELDLELSEGKGGEGADGLLGRRMDALADFQASDVL